MYGSDERVYTSCIVMAPYNIIHKAIIWLLFGSGVIEGVDWVANQHRSGKKSVAKYVYVYLRECSPALAIIIISYCMQYVAGRWKINFNGQRCQCCCG